jgi:hypothetical protein
LAVAEETVSADHPDLLNYRNSLATAYLENGQTHEGIPLLQATLADAERALGDDHPITALVRHNLTAALADGLPEAPL